MEASIKALEAQVGPYSRFHLFLYQRIASLHMIMQNLEGVEESFKKSIEVAEKTTEPLHKDMDQTSAVFMW